MCSLRSFLKWVIFIATEVYNRIKTKDFMKTIKFYNFDILLGLHYACSDSTDIGEIENDDMNMFAICT